MPELIDEQLLRSALVAFEDVRAPSRPVARYRIRPMRFGAVLAAVALVLAGSAVAAQRVVLQPLGVFGLDARYGPLRDRDFIVSINANDVAPEITHAGLVLQRRENSGEVRVYATTNVDGSHGIGISEDGNPASLGCCASEADLAAPLHVGLQLGRSVDPVAYPDTWAGWVGSRTVAVALEYSDGSADAADVKDGYFVAMDHAPDGARPVALVARAGDGSELGRLAVSRG